MKLKICGMRNDGNIAAIASLCPDYMGFIFYGSSPRNACEVPAGVLESVPCEIKKVGVFVDATLGEIEETVSKYSLDMVQLHGGETPDFCGEIRRLLPVVKAFGVSSGDDFRLMEDYCDVCDYFLLDTKTHSKGGSGRKFGWELLEMYRYEKPFFLSGGIGPEDAEIIREIGHSALYGVDINSCFETAPGMKDPEMVREFIENLKR